MNREKYSMSFTVAALLRQESLNLAELYLKQGDWAEVRSEVLVHNLLQARAENSAKRTCTEIISRLQQLSHNEIDLLVVGSQQEQGYLLWLAVCRRYRFIYEFSDEVIRERFFTLKYDLSYGDYDVFFHAKMVWHGELEKLTKTTKNKLRQVVFKMLREADLLTLDNQLIPAILSARLINIIGHHSPRDLYIFPVINTTL
ncbi:MAG: DUF1819 family protein [Gammaproteobacteria bacterium]|nr:DUF1819 family protein [Gammaproteobacteria bacterium]